MAADAFEATQKRMAAETEARLAALINQDILQLREKAQERGVTAYTLNPVQRERVNDRFLRGTLRGVQSANKRAQEDDMWAQREAQRRSKHMQSGPATQSAEPRSRPVSELGPASAGEDRVTESSMTADSSQGADYCSSASDEEPRRPAQPIDRWGTGGTSAASDDDLEEMRAQRRVRGRGAVGARADEPGPYLPGPSQGVQNVLGKLHAGDVWPVATSQVAAGPPRPPWMPQLEGTEGTRLRISTTALKSALGLRSKGAGSPNLEGMARPPKKQKQDKHTKKDKSKKKKREKKKRRKE